MKKMACLAAVLWGVAIFGVFPSHGAEPIKFGFIQALSGGVGQLSGIPEKVGLEIAVEEINASGGILGRPVQAIIRDDKLSPETGVREAKDLVLNEKVNWIQGTVGSAVAFAVSAYAKENKVLFFVTCSSSSGLTEEKGHRYVFRQNSNTVAYARALAYATAKQWPGQKKVFTLCPDYEYGHRMKDDFMETYAKLVPDAKVIGELWPKLGTSDYTPYITKIMNSECDFVYSAIWGGDMISFIKTAWAFGYFDKIKMVAENFGAMDYLEPLKGQEYPKGVLGGSVYPFWLINNPLNDAFWPKFKKRAGMEANTSAAQGYMTLYAMKGAVEKAGSLDTEKVINALEGLENNSLIGNYKIRACDHQSIKPFWVGPVTKDEKFPWPHITNAIALDAEKAYHTCAEVEALRKK